ncbi:hypothetical protein LINPERHAP2_LOCUS12267 [Linum perenne]
MLKLNLNFSFVRSNGVKERLKPLLTGTTEVVDKGYLCEDAKFDVVADGGRLRWSSMEEDEGYAGLLMEKNRQSVR